MRMSEDQVKDIVALKQNLTGQIEKYQNAIAMLEKNLTILDLALKESSFTKASHLEVRKADTPAEEPDTPAEEPDTPAEEPDTPAEEPDTPAEEPDIPAEEPDTDLIPIKHGNDGEVIANVRVTPEQISITLNKDIQVGADTPPFKSFFLDRTVGGMRKKDDIEVQNGRIQKESVIDCSVNEDESGIREIVIKGYRQKERVDELISKVSWSLTKMLENVAG